MLIVEDNLMDSELTLWALREAGYGGEAIAVSDGVEAIAFLKREPPYASQPLPDLVILDLNLKLVDGPEVLQFIRETPELERTRVVILSSSPEYIMRSKAAKADGYFSKSSSLEHYAELGKKLVADYLSG